MGFLALVKSIFPKALDFSKSLFSSKAKSGQSKSKKLEGKPTKRRDPKWQTWFPFTLVYGNGKIQPLYLLAWLLITLLITFEGVKIFAAWKAIKSGGYTPEHLPTADFGLLIGLVPTIILLYNTTKNTTPEA